MQGPPHSGPLESDVVMTRQKHLKDRIRARMDKTGERYTVARRHVLAKAAPPAATGPTGFHLPGNVPATTALRVLLKAANVRPDGVDDLNEAMLFGIAGGVGAGVFAFRYEKEDFSSFFVAGRHLWQDDLAYLQAACQRLGVSIDVREAGGAKAADKQLREALAEGSPVVAWVDRAGLPRYVMPESAAGGLYHVVTVYEIDDATSEAVIGDLADDPERVPLDVFAVSRARIKKQKNRILRVTESGKPFDLRSAVVAGVAACHDTLIGRGAVKPPGGKAMAASFTLDAFKTWAIRLHGSADRQGWEKMFRPGINLWRGLTSIASFIHYGTGGGLCRPLYAEFFREAGPLLNAPLLGELADRYERLGHAWDSLAEAALSGRGELFSRFRGLVAERAELVLSGGADALSRLREIASELTDLELSAATGFPLAPDECDELLSQLQSRVMELHREEVEAHGVLGEFVRENS